MTRSLPVTALALAIAFAVPQTLYAQDKGASYKPVLTQEAKNSQAEAYDKVVKDLKRVDGPFVLYQRKKDLLLELPEDKLGQIFLIQVALETGLDSGQMSAGFPANSDTPIDAFRFDLHDDQVYLVRPRISTRWDKDNPYAVGGDRQFQEATLASYHVEATNPNKKLLLVNVTKLFSGDVFRLGEMIMTGLGGPFMLDSEKSGPETVKGFSDNTVVTMKQYYISPRGASENPLFAILGISAPNTLEDSRSAPVKFTYSVWFRKDDGYKPRVADERVGYFDISFFSLNKYLNDDRMVHYINRFNLQYSSKDRPCLPVKPIVFTIDNSIPAEYRPAIKEGILRWNKAFDALGFKEAVKVQDQPNDPDYDHADGRYNVVRMMVSPSSPFSAVSLFRTDPFTGEILNASITLDANMIRDGQNEHIQNQTVQNGSAKAMAVLLRDSTRTIPDDEFLFQSPQEAALSDLNAKMSKFGWSHQTCTYAQGAMNDTAMSWASLQMVPHTVNKEEYVKRSLAETVSHEAGHALGLRHNFAGSTNLSPTQLADDNLTNQQGTSASVMDYTPSNVMAVLRGSGNFFSPVIGPYDLWAIKYGYSQFDDRNSMGEKYALAQIASESSKPGHAYMTDEDADKWNPSAVRFDESSDPLLYSQKLIDSLKRAQSYAILNLPRKGESYEKRTTLIMTAYQHMFREGTVAARFIGGVINNRNFKGDVGEKPTIQIVPAMTQRSAAQMIARDFLSPNAFPMDSKVMTSLSVDPTDNNWTAPIRSFLGGSQQSMLALMLSASTCDRIAENQFKVKQSYGLDEHLNTIVENVFQEVGQNEPIGPLRRDLQRFAVGGFISISSAPSGGVNEDERMLVNNSLKELRTKIENQLRNPGQLDNMTKIHLRDMDDTISRYLNRSA